MVQEFRYLKGSGRGMGRSARHGLFSGGKTIGVAFGGSHKVAVATPLGIPVFATAVSFWLGLAAPRADKVRRKAALGLGRSPKH